MVISILVSTTHRHGSSPLAAVSLVFFLLVLRASAVDASGLDAIIGTAVRKCLQRSDITEENAADLMKMDLSAFRKCLRGEGRQQLGIARLMRLGLTFWTYFTPTLLYHAARLHCEQVRDDAIETAKALMGRRT